MEHQLTTEAVFRTLGRLESKLDAMNSKLDEHLAKDESVHSDHEARIRSSEKFRWTAVGGAGVLGSVFSLAVAFLKDWL